MTHWMHLVNTHLRPEPSSAKIESRLGRGIVRLHGRDIHVGAVIKLLRKIAEFDAALAKCRVSGCGGGVGVGGCRYRAGKDRGQEGGELHSGWWFAWLTG